ncbi:MAG: hypothetical protein JXA09_01040 [Anaerolineae bacterium]|nr:hypothetical protein [Anaerolineae bacterium]
MSDRNETGSAAEIARIIESAARLGVEVDEGEALQWLAAIASWDKSNHVVFDPDSGVFGHTVTMLDFSPEDLAYFRSIGKLVEFHDQPGVVETALALSGSAAQSKIQMYPGDCDYFERVNVRAETREAACRILSQLIRDKALSTDKGPTYKLIQVRFGSFPEDVIVGGRAHSAGSSIAWDVDQVAAGQIDAAHPDGRPTTIGWDDVAGDPGWCKLDWVVADPIRGRLANASNMLDVTWEAPDGTITPLDGYLDPYFQEVYLQADSIPVFSKLVRHVSEDALDEYVHQLEKEVRKYVSGNANYGKAAKRMYNIFRYTGRYEEAAYLRELFDEPTTILYQVWALVRTLDEALLPGSDIPLETVNHQADQLILGVVGALTGAVELEMVEALLNVRHALTSKAQHEETWLARVEGARQAAINIVNNFFYERLTAIPGIKDYIEHLQAEERTPL